MANRDNSRNPRRRQTLANRSSSNRMSARQVNTRPSSRKAISPSGAQTRNAQTNTRVANRTGKAARTHGSGTVRASGNVRAGGSSGRMRPADSFELGEQSQQAAGKRIGDIRRAERLERAKSSSRRYLLRLIIILGVIVALLAGWAALYNSPVFSIEHVEVEGVEHLTSDEMAQLANIPADTTLLRVDTETIRKRIMQNAWVSDVQINRLFPDTLRIAVTERAIKAVVLVPNRAGSAVKSWAIAEDHMWLMPIPEKNTEAAKTTSAKIYEDAASALAITDVPYGTNAEIGQICQDSNVNNALDIITGMTTELASQVVTVSAAGPAETTLILENGVEIAFGKAEDIRDKERVILQILADNPDGVAYINVRMVETPTWRAI